MSTCQINSLNITNNCECIECGYSSETNSSDFTIGSSSSSNTSSDSFDSSDSDSFDNKRKRLRLRKRQRLRHQNQQINTEYNNNNDVPIIDNNTSTLTKETPFIKYLINKRTSCCQMGPSTHIAAFVSVASKDWYCFENYRKWQGYYG